MKPNIKYISVAEDNKSLTIIPSKEGAELLKVKERFVETTVTIAKQVVLAYRYDFIMPAKYVEIQYKYTSETLVVAVWTTDQKRDGFMMPLFTHDNKPTT